MLFCFPQMVAIQ
jgi:Mn2+/Fe2+ NRAMP family transporter